MIRRRDEHVAMPWANGGGTTYQVAASPAGAGPRDVDWRISIAEITEAGEFSAFPSIDRCLTVIDGPGMELTIDGERVAAAPLAPVYFSGDAMVSCELFGPTSDLNVMTRRGRCTATVEVVTAGSFSPAPGVITAVVVLTGSWRLGIAEGTVLAPRDCLWVDATTDLVGTGAAALVRIDTHPVAL